MSKTLIMSVSDGDEESAELLLAPGAQGKGPAVVNATSADTPMITIRLIRADFNVRRWCMFLQHRRVTLYFAMDKGFAKVMQALLATGATANVRDGHW